jgi:Rhodopirellula transposase DDE domain
VIPYGVYDLGANTGWVSVGVDHDTPEFAVQSIQQWWRKMGRKRYPTATDVLITPDAGGSNSARARLWKVALQRLATETGLRISVCHFPPGTSKWNKIEHRMFCHITENWRGRPLISHEVVVNLIANTTTEQGTPHPSGTRPAALSHGRHRHAGRAQGRSPHARSVPRRLELPDHAASVIQMQLLTLFLDGS